MRGMGSQLALTLTVWAIGLTVPAAALDVPGLLDAVANSPEPAAARHEAAVRRAEAKAEAQLDPWSVELRQEGLGPTEGGNQVSYLTLTMPFDPYGRQAARTGALERRAEVQLAQARQFVLDRQLDALGWAWEYLSLSEQLKATDEALGRLNRWHGRLKLRVEGGKLAEMELDRFAVLRGEVTARQAALVGRQGELAAELVARNLSAYVTGPLPDPATVPQANEATPLPGLEALTAEQRSLEAQIEALRLSRLPAPSLTVEGERFGTFSRGEHAVGIGLGLELPNQSRLAAEQERLQQEGAVVAARQAGLTQQVEAWRRRQTAVRDAAAAERRQLQADVIPGIDRQIDRYLALIGQGRSDVFALLDLERRRLDARLRAIELHAAELQGGYALWLLAGGFAAR